MDHAVTARRLYDLISAPSLMTMMQQLGFVPAGRRA